MLQLGMSLFQDRIIHTEKRSLQGGGENATKTENDDLEDQIQCLRDPTTVTMENNNNNNCQFNHNSNNNRFSQLRVLHSNFTHLPPDHLHQLLNTATTALLTSLRADPHQQQQQQATTATTAALQDTAAATAVAW